MSVAEWSGSLVEWERELRSWKSRLGPVFGRRQLRETGGTFLDGLLSGIERKTGWMMAEQAGLSRPWRMQGLLGRNRWDADALRDDVHQGRFAGPRSAHDRYQVAPVHFEIDAAQDRHRSRAEDITSCGCPSGEASRIRPAPVSANYRCRHTEVSWRTVIGEGGFRSRPGIPPAHRRPEPHPGRGRVARQTRPRPVHEARPTGRCARLPLSQGANSTSTSARPSLSRNNC